MADFNDNLKENFMEREIYCKDYVECFKKVNDIVELTIKLLYPNKFRITKIDDVDVDLEEIIENIKEDLEDDEYPEIIGYTFTNLLQIYFPEEKIKIESYKSMMDSYQKLNDLYNNLNDRYLPFIKRMTILYYPDQGKKHTDDFIWELSLKNDTTVEMMENKIDNIIWGFMDSGSFDVVDDFLKESYHLSDIEFNRYMGGNPNHVSSISRNDEYDDKINVNFKMFDKYFEDIYGQDAAIQVVKKVLKRNILFYNAEDLKETNKKNNSALATFMFYGPTGTGKTETAKIIADFVFGNKDQLLILDMNSYKDSKVASSALKGHPEGYIDSDKGTDFTRFLSKNTKGVIVLDEFEKADKSVRELFMNMLDEGSFKDALGNVYDLSAYIFIATTNASEKLEHKVARMGFGTPDKDEEIKEQENNIKDSLREIFTSPIMNRFNNLVHFKKIEYEDALLICENVINKMCDMFTNKKFGKITPKIKINNINEISKVILKECNFEKDGVRSLKNVVNDVIGSEIIEQIYQENADIVIDCSNNKITVKKSIKRRV